MVTAMSTFLPLINYLVVVPYIFYPSRWGIPYNRPNGFVIAIASIVIMLVELVILGTVSGIMNTVKECNRYDVKIALKRSLWIIIGYIVGNITLFFLPFLKAPFLIVGMGLPYAGWLIHGFMVSIPVMLFGAMGTTKILADICT